MKNNNFYYESEKYNINELMETDVLIDFDNIKELLESENFNDSKIDQIKEIFNNLNTKYQILINDYQKLKFKYENLTNKFNDSLNNNDKNKDNLYYLNENSVASDNSNYSSYDFKLKLDNNTLINKIKKYLNEENNNQINNNEDIFENFKNINKENSILKEKNKLLNKSLLDKVKIISIINKKINPKNIDLITNKIENLYEELNFKVKIIDKTKNIFKYDEEDSTLEDYEIFLNNILKTYE